MSNKRITKNNLGKGNRRLLLWCAAAFVMTLAATMIAVGVKGIFPFGKLSIYYSDLIYEFSVFLTELWRKVHAGGSLFYSWKTGLGGVFWGNLLDYVSSPLNLLVLLVKESQIDEAIAVLIYLRQALAAAFMCFFLCRRRGGQASFPGALCGFLYAVCGWFCGYYYSIIWLDAFMLMPLLLLGIERIIDQRRPGLYFAMFTVILLSNFYMAYCVAVFAIVYWLYYFFAYYDVPEFAETKGQKQKTPFFRSRFFTAGTVFAVSSVLSVLCLAVLFVPLLQQVSRNQANADVSSAADWFGSFAKHVDALFSGARSPSNSLQHYPAIYTGVLVFAAAPLFFFLKKTTKRGKIATGLLAALMVLSFNLPPLDYVWHGFRFPTNFPFRQSFFFSIVLVIMIYRVLTGVRELPGKSMFIFIGAAAVIVVCGVAVLLRREENGVISLGDFIVTVVLFLLFCGMFALLRYGKKEQLAAATAFLFLFSFCDGTYTFFSNLQVMEMYAEPYAEKEKVDSVLGSVNEEQLFYRTEMTNLWIINDGAFFDYNGIRQSSSVAAAKTLKLMNSLGCDSNLNNFIGYNTQTPVFNSIFGVKYLLEQNSYADYSGVSYLSCAGESYRFAETKGDYSLYCYGNALSLGFSADRALTEWKAEEHAAEVNQSSFYAAAAGSDESVLIYCDEEAEAVAIADNTNTKELGDHLYHIEKKELDAEEKEEVPVGVSLNIKAKISGWLYVCVEETEGAFNTVSFWAVNEEAGDRPMFSSVSNSICCAVYDAKKDEELTIGVSPTADTPCTLRIRVFQIDPAVLGLQHETIAKSGQLELTEFSDTHFEGTIDVAGGNRVLCVTVPYDPGWTVTLDGKTLSEEEFSLIGGALYGIPVEEGSHTVRFDYSLPGLPSGAVISCCAAVAVVGFFIALRKMRVRLTEGRSASETEQ
ncbi:MAG: YfhO family protein [Clostridia bacterium]|nr:YfhO family protein [Clostridia bacterium]